MRNACVNVVLVCCCAAGGAEAQERDLVIVTAQEARLRARPEASSQIVATLQKGTVLEVRDREPGWLLVMVPREFGGRGDAAYVVSESVAAYYGVPQPPPGRPSGIEERPPVTTSPSAGPPASPGGGQGTSNRAQGPETSLGIKVGLLFSSGDLDIGTALQGGADFLVTSKTGVGAYLDASYTRKSESDTASVAGVRVSASGNVSWLKIAAGPVFRAPTGRARAYAGAGVAFFRLSAGGSASVGGVNVSASSSDTVFGFDTFAGVQISLAGRTAGVLEARFVRGSDEDASFGGLYVSAGIRF